jgi:class 3 adenylate cyclase/predicted ATPase
VQCPRCTAENRDGARFCRECGATFGAVCSGCGAKVEAGSRFCDSCGAPLAATSAQPTAPPRFVSLESYTPKHLAETIVTSKSALEGERKLVTVLFADLKGSMELLADRDPEEARKLLDPVLERMMDAVHRYEGTVNQVMGDGIMALFGAPVAHEDHGVRACYAALDMQAAIRRYADEVWRAHGIKAQIRVGLNSGEVVVRAIGSDLHMDYTAVGQTTHLAARMEQLATPGTVLLTADTLRLAEGYVTVKPLGPVPVKGLEALIEVYELTGAGPLRSRLHAAAARGLTRFVGRGGELDQLRQALGRAAGGQGQVVAIVGEPGVGKSRLVWEVTRSHRVDGWLVLQAGSASYGKATSYLPVVDLLKRYFVIEDRDGPRAGREKMTGKLLTLDRAQEGSLPAFLSLLDVPTDDPQWPTLDPTQRRRRTLDAVKRLLLRESQVQPLLVVFEDLHWIDSETQALLDGLVESLPATRLLLLVNYRPEYQHPWGSRTYYTQLRLDPLPPETAEELLGALLGPDAGLDPLKRVLIMRTEGNPFFLEESVRSLAETGALVGERGAYRLTRAVEHLEIPATIQAILAARIDRQSPEDKRLLQAAAVVGKDVPMPLLLAIAETAEGEVRAGLGRLQAAEFLYETSLFPEPEYTFKHALTHEVAYGSILHERRRVLHGRIVETIEKSYATRISEYVERLGHHALRAESWDRAIAYLRQAGAKAAARSANVEAIDHLTKGLDALKHVPEGPDRLRLELDLQITLGPALMTTKGYGAPEVERAYERALELCRRVGEDPELFAVLHGLWLHYWVRGDIPTMLDLAQQLSDLAQRAGDRALRLVADDVMGEVAVYLGDFPAARSHMEQCVSLYDPSQHRSLGFRYGGYDPGMAARAIGAHALWCLGFPDQALAWSRDAVALARDLSHLTTLAFALGHAGILHYLRQEPRLTLEVAEEALALSAGEGLEFWKAFAEILRGWSLVRQQRGAEGIESMRHGLEGYRVTAGELESPIWLAMMADAYLVEAAPEKGLSAVAEALELVNTMGVRFAEAELYRLRGELLLTQGGAAAEDAEGAFRRALEVAAGQKARCLELRAAMSLARLEQARGERRLAHQTLAEVYKWFTEGFDTSDLRETRTLLEEMS